MKNSYHFTTGTTQTLQTTEGSHKENLLPAGKYFSLCLFFSFYLIFLFQFLYFMVLQQMCQHGLGKAQGLQPKNYKAIRRWILTVREIIFPREEHTSWLSNNKWSVPKHIKSSIIQIGQLQWFSIWRKHKMGAKRSATENLGGWNLYIQGTVKTSVSDFLKWLKTGYC